MEMNNFESVVITRRGEVLRWLCGRYKDLRMDDGEDIIQESSCELWKWGKKMVNLTEKDFVSMWKVMSRNIYTHWLAKSRYTEEWDDKRLQYGWEEHDYGWARGNETLLRKRELLYDCIDAMKDKDRRLMEMLLAKTKMKDIAENLGYKNEQVAKNRKRTIIKSIQKELATSTGNENVACVVLVA